MQTKASVTATGLAVMIAGLLATGGAWADNWLAQIGGLGAEDVFDLVETSDRRLCATGTFTGTASFGAAAQLVTLHAEVGQDVYVACFSPDGALEMAVQFGGDISDQPRAIAALPGGDIVITGYFLNTFGAGGSKALKASGGADIFLIRLNPEGEAVWSRKFGGSFADKGNSLAVTPDGDILLSGHFQDVVAYESGGTTRKLTSAGGRDAFVLRIDDGGNVVWAESFGGTGNDNASRVISGRDGQVYLAGTFEDTAMIGRGSATLSTADGEDAFLIALDANGELGWAHQISGASREYVSGLATDARGDLYISGNFFGELDPPNGVTLHSVGGTDIFLLKFDAAGQWQWSRRVGGTENEESFDLAVSADHKLILSGHFQSDFELPVRGKLVKLEASGMGNPDGLILTFDSEGQYSQVITATGDGVETVFTVTSLQGGGVASAGFFNQEVTLHVDGLSKLIKRGNTDVFVARVVGSNLITAAGIDAIRIRQHLGAMPGR